ncbi:SAM-dependent methyltransferase [Paraflavitalea pollutisoli]|uniref:SAM-dependent methyltransferase n=1 Tax=Paraflavitalea pollutisoli TaxID=3034143 RepID=UPI0023EDEFE3|nr:SAM-dependent methyltransferase [Paraflavitalea sp. H1-2-19X]
MSSAKVYLIPCFLHETATQTIPAYVLDAVKECQVFFVENERSARRYLKVLWKEMVIDDYTWVTIHKAEDAVRNQFRQHLKAGRTIGIISEAGCPGVADPGQILAGLAHEANAVVKPLTGPSALLLALMGSGMNGQQFQFVGYLPIDTGHRFKAIREIEAASALKQCTQIFIETPYRNNQLLEALLKGCQPNTRICVATDLTSTTEFIQTKTVAEWKKGVPDLHKRPTVFCLLAGSR